MADVEAGCGRLLQKLKPDESVQGWRLPINFTFF
jgi:hypothetical protein